MCGVEGVELDIGLLSDDSSNPDYNGHIDLLRDDS